MKDLGVMHYFLGLEVLQTEGHFFVGQGKYTFHCGSSYLHSPAERYYIYKYEL